MGARLTDRMRPYSIEGISPNFIERQGSARLRSIFGDAKYERLLAVKREWDPDNVFSSNQDLDPDLP